MSIDILRPGTNLHLYSEATPDFDRVWTIGEKIGQGGSSICYKAKCGNKMGRLKEFFPAIKSNRDSFERNPTVNLNIKRDKTGQIYFDNESDRKKYILMRDSFLSSYRLLDKIKADKAEGGIINNYIPTFLILFGKSNGVFTGAYIWTPDDKHGKTFDEYIREMIDIEEIEPEKRLYYILKVILGLADCMCVFHSMGLLHFDIKPSNFLVAYNRSKNIDSGIISLFDINTLTPIGSESQNVKVTDGYSAPELYYSRGDNRSDIYSIGAVLYTSLISDDENGVAFFDEGKYNSIDKMLKNARIITSSKINSGIFMLEMLSKILKGCLNRYPENRYPDCEALITDLKTAMTYLLPVVESETLGQKKKLVILDMEEKINPVAVIQNLIYTKPLYTYLNDSKELRILVMGDDSYAKSFIDLTLQHGQIDGKMLKINVLCKNARMTKTEYYMERPGLLDYIRRDGNRVSITFEDSGETESERDKKIVHKLTDNVNKIHYCFISDGGDEYNKNTARFCTFLTGNAGYKAIIAYRMENEYLQPGKTGEPVYVYSDFDRALKKKLKNMAFKVHCIWSGTNDEESDKRQFRKKYNAESSLNFAISIKYKLYSLGIDTEDEKEAASKFEELILDEKNVVRLTSFEHRRWAMDLLTKGWNAPKQNNMNSFLEGSVSRCAIKDKSHKLHHCLVPSTESTPLKTSLWEQDGQKRWDIAGEYDRDLDPLDRVSVEVHRFFKNKASIISKCRLKESPDILRIRDVIQMAGVSHSCIESLDRFSEKISKVQEGDIKASISYDNYFKELKADFAKISGLTNYLKAIEDRLNILYRDVFILAEAGMYRDYKAYDEILVRKINDIMTD